MTTKFSIFPERFAYIAKAVKSNKPFVIGDQDLTYGEVIGRINKTSNFFEGIGLEIGDRVVVACGDDLETAILYLATLQFGLTIAIIDPRSSTAEATLLTETIGPQAIFFDEDLLNATLETSDVREGRHFAIKARRQSVQKSKFGLTLISGAEESGSDKSYPSVSDGFGTDFPKDRKIPEDQTALVLFTSGTTSQPKGVELTHRNLGAQFETFLRHYGFDESSRILNHLPLHHTDGLNQGPAIAFYAGATWFRRGGNAIKNLPTLLAGVKELNATHFITVPTILALIDQLSGKLDSPFSSPKFRYIASTAGYLDTELWSRLEEQLGTTIVNSYGLTETVSEALYCGPTADTRKVGTIGRPVDCEARVVDDEFAAVPCGTTGELVIRGDNVMKGYYSNREASQSVLRDGWLLTGDLATCDEDGFYQIVGRKKNVIVRAGINVYPEDVTNVVMQFPEVVDAVTLGMSEFVAGESVVTAVTASLEDDSLPGQIIEHCRKLLAPEKVPDKILVFDELPRGPAGKVILRELRNLIEARSGGEAVGPQEEKSVESQVVGIAATAFGILGENLDLSASSESTKDWDSLSHLKLIMALEQTFMITLSPDDIMQISSLSDAVDLVNEKSAV
jgi:long-chain acyl-CoA synthetase